MRAAVCLAAVWGLAAAQHDAATLVDDRMDVRHEHVNFRLGVTGTQDGTVSTDTDGSMLSTLVLNRQTDAAATDDEWTYMKVHFGYFTIPVSASVDVCSADGSECYTYEKWSGSDKKIDPREGQDGGNRFSSMTVDGHSVMVKLRLKVKKDWNDAMHGVVVRKLEKGRHSPPEAPAGTPGREGKKLSICGQNERLDAVCHKQKYPEEFKRSYNVARLYIGHAGGVCTAWRVSAGNLMMTNNHCFKEQWELSSSELHFNYQKTRCGGSRADAGTVKVSPDRLLRTSGPLDYTIFTLTNTGFDTVRRWRGSGGETFGYFTLEPRQPRLGERIYIPQHGAGDPKQISITDDQDGGLCKIKNIDKWGDNTLLGYSCDTVGGSSGSPVVLGANHRVIGLHNKGGCPTYTNGGVQIQYIWPEISQFFDGAPVPPAPAPPPPPVRADCQGYWGKCKADCTRSYYRTTSARNGGKCPPDSAYATREPCNSGTDDCFKGCVGSCSGKNCGDDGCGKSCGTCWSGYDCQSGSCTRVTPAPAPPPVGIPSCGSKACNYVVSGDGSCPSGYELIGSPVQGCDTAEDECEYAFAEAIRARGSGDRPREYQPPKPASSPWWSSVPGRCYVEQFSSSEYLFFNTDYSASGTLASRQKAVCRKRYFRGPGCRLDQPSAACTPSCWGKECGDDGCGGQCGPGCDVSAGEKCSSVGQCMAPTCGSFASICAKPGYKMGDSSKTCSKTWTGGWCSQSECCVRRYCSSDAYCDTSHDMVPSANTAVCEECDGSTLTVNPKSCCFPKTFDPVSPPCPADRYSAGFCGYVVSASAKSYNKYRYCNDPDGPYTVHCKTSCKAAGYNVCGAELMSAVSLAADQGSSSGLSMPAIAGIALGTCLLGLFAGLLIAKRTGGQQDLEQTVSHSPSRHLKEVRSGRLSDGADI